MATKKFFGLVSVAALVASFGTGCSSSTEVILTGDAGKVDSGKRDTGTPQPIPDGGQVDPPDTYVPPPPVDGGPGNPDTAPPPPPKDGGPVKPDATPIDPDTGTPTGGPGTTGSACKVKGDCDLNGDGNTFCSKGGLQSTLYFPDPVCMGWCDLSTPAPDQYWTVAEACDINADQTDYKGLCKADQAGSTSGVCWPKCTVDAAGTAVTGCVGRSTCDIGFGGDNGGGLGTCGPSCASDSDCTGLPNNGCHPLYGACLPKSRITPYAGAPAGKFAKDTGTACTDFADETKQECICMADKAEGKGYCISFCSTGATTGMNSCSGGTVCSPLWNKTGEDGGAPFISAVPNGVQGYCVKTCKTSADCSAFDNQECNVNILGQEGVCLPKN